jgi:HEAT repeats
VCVGRDDRSAGYNFGVEDLILESLPTSAGEFEPEVKHQLEPELPAAVPTETPGTPVYRGHPLADYVAKLQQAAEPGRADLLRAIGSFGADGAPAAGLVAGTLADSEEQVRAAAAWSLSQIGAPAAKSAPATVGALAKALSDPNPKVRSLAAVALEAMGPAAAAALPELVRGLNDPADYVRAKAADALGAMGPGERAAVRPLADRLLVKDEQMMVLGSVAAALGDIGPAALDALPVLEQTRGTVRLGYTVEAAILKIQGKPVPSWW